MASKKKRTIPWKKLLIGELNWKRPFKLLGFVYLSLLVIALFFANFFIFPIPPSSYSEKNVRNLEFLQSHEEVKIATRFWKARQEKALVLYFHGNAVDIGMLDPFAEYLGEYGFSVLTMDYQGYGLSEGTPNEKNCYADAERLFTLAIEKGYQPNQILIWGRSLGGGIATEMASRKNVRGLILESTFCSAFRTATRLPILPFDQFNNLAKIGKIEEPLFLLHGSHDTVIAPWHTETLQQAHQGKNIRFVIQGAKHDNLWTKNLEKEFQQLDTFFFR